MLLPFAATAAAVARLPSGVAAVIFAFLKLAGRFSSLSWKLLSAMPLAGTMAEALRAAPL